MTTGSLSEPRGVLETALDIIESIVVPGTPAEGRFEHLEVIADALPVLISYIDRDLIYRFVNRSYERWFGTPREQLIGRSMHDVLGEAALHALMPQLEAVLAGNVVEFERDVTYRGLGPRTIRGSYAPHVGADGRVVGFVALVQDHTQQRALERERESLLERLALLARVSDVLASSLDYELTLRHVIELAIPLLGDFGFFDVCEGEDGEVRRIALAHADPRKQALLDATRWERSTRTDINVCALSSGHPALHPDIDDAWLQNVATCPEHLALMKELSFGSMLTVPLTYQGRTRGSLTLFFLKGNRSHTEADFLLCQELARRAAASVENARLFKQAQEAINVRDDFLSVAGHELRTPLTALQLQVLSIEKLLKDGAPLDKILTRSQKASRNVVRLGVLVNELLDISRISAGRLTLEPTSFALADAVKDVLSRLSEELLRAGCLVELAADRDVVGTWDRMRIEQVATNLVTNALKYGKGKPIDVRVERSGDHARLVVQDAGIGISADDQARIFQRFERAVSSRHFGGLGLGLWITRQLVEAHGGSIAVESRPEHGATFSVLLPLSRD